MQSVRINAMTALCCGCNRSVVFCLKIATRPRPYYYAYEEQ